MATFALLASPLLGASVWHPVASELGRRGRRTVICATTATRADDVLDQFATALPRDEVVLVPHSNAGAYVPALTAAADVGAAVFVDAVLPPAGGMQPLAPPPLVAQLRSLADDDGWLPPWTQWWDESEIGGLLPDETTRARVESDQRRMPIDYFTESLAVPVGWADRPCAYLALSDAYLPALDDAAARGWPTRFLNAGHLHQLVAPVEVADAIEALLALT